ncbi:ATP-binding response regulator [Carboxylicivirga caseinilyticus]|uniref:ATP-binding response regulator n=1 Tax=Carboxylicivirga caseinilyticus TaxID=3417572 RepID=UPI003D34DC5C|nr:hybrid sensor histidine kinase/response regulator [Marinilabiliaceae bacterium A049]
MSITLAKPIKNGRILIVDDNPRNIQVLGNILKENQYLVEFATSGAGALEWIGVQCFDLILLDIVLPDMNGFQVCEKIRAKYDLDSLPVIFLSAHNDTNNVHYGFKIGAQDFITKPFNRGDLLMRVRTHILLKKNIDKLKYLNETLEQKVEERTRALNLAKEAAERNDRLKTIFLQNLSHEIRTPLNGIFGFTQLLKLNLEEKENYIHYIEMIEHSGEHMLSMINDLVILSKIESGQNIDICIEEVDLNEMLDEIILTFQPRIKDKGLKLFKRVKIPDGFMFETDKEKIFQVFMNLINNAIKYTPSGYIEIKICYFDSKIEFSVKDTGVGIPKNMHKVIFERFVQGKTYHNRPFEGSGVGLSISKALIEALGGEIWVESEPEKGAIFKFSLS